MFFLYFVTAAQMDWDRILHERSTHIPEHFIVWRPADPIRS